MRHDEPLRHDCLTCDMKDGKGAKDAKGGKDKKGAAGAAGAKKKAAPSAAKIALKKTFEKIDEDFFTELGDEVSLHFFSHPLLSPPCLLCPPLCLMSSFVFDVFFCVCIGVGMCM